MAIDQSYAVDLAQAVAHLYQQAELDLVQMIAKKTLAGASTSGWQANQLASIQQTNQATKVFLSKVKVSSDAAAREALLAGYLHGVDVASKELKQVGAAKLVFGGPNQGALTALVDKTQQTLGASLTTITSQAGQAHRNIVQQVTAQVLTGTRTQQEAVNHAVQQFADKGIGSFVDKSGKTWNMATYAEMAVRTSSQQALVAGHVNRLTASNQDLVIVSDAPEECEICRPWEGKVLSLTGNTKPGMHAVEGKVGAGSVFIVKGTLADAKAAGLLHPGCRHSIAAYFPGVTPPLKNTADPKGAALRQKQRQLEVRERQLKRRVEVAKATGDPAVLKAANKKLKDHQAGFKQWRTDNGRKDLAYRRSINAPPIKSPAKLTNRADELQAKIDEAFEYKLPPTVAKPAPVQQAVGGGQIPQPFTFKPAPQGPNVFKVSAKQEEFLAGPGFEWSPQKIQAFKSQTSQGAHGFSTDYDAQYKDYLKSQTAPKPKLVNEADLPEDVWTPPGGAKHVPNQPPPPPVHKPPVPHPTLGPSYRLSSDGKVWKAYKFKAHGKEGVSWKQVNPDGSVMAANKAKPKAKPTAPPPVQPTAAVPKPPAPLKPDPVPSTGTFKYKPPAGSKPDPGASAHGPLLKAMGWSDEKFDAFASQNKLGSTDFSNDWDNQLDAFNNQPPLVVLKNEYQKQKAAQYGWTQEDLQKWVQSGKTMQAYHDDLLYSGISKTKAPAAPQPGAKPVKTETGHLEFEKSAGNAWATQQWPTASSGHYTQTELSALKSYTGSGYRATNEKLRQSGGTSGASRGMDSAFKKAPRVPEDVIVGRGASLQAIGVRYGETVDPVKLVGTELVDHGYMSTSVASKGHFGGDVNLRLRVPKGHPAVFVSHAQDAISVFGRSENELILARGTKMKVVKVWRENSQWQVEVDVIGHGLPGA